MILRRLFQSLAILTLAGTVTNASAEDPKNPFSDEDFVSVEKFSYDGNGKLINSPFQFQVHEVTFAQWNILNRMLKKKHQDPWKHPSKPGFIAFDGYGVNYKSCVDANISPETTGPNYPAVCISVPDALEYIRVLNKIDKKYVYRLPTYDEFNNLMQLTWIAARIAHSSEISYYNIPIDRYAWYQRNSDYHLHEVCTKKRILGLCDVMGNAREWSISKVSPRNLGDSDPYDYPYPNYFNGGSVYTDMQACLKNWEWCKDESLASKEVRAADMTFRLIREVRSK